MLKILIVDDFLPDRISIESLLRGLTHLELEITAGAEHGLQALEHIAASRPDIVITDIEMPFCDGFELARNIRIRYPEIKIIFCSFYEEFKYARQALYFGGYGYILKPIDAMELEQCIQSITGKISHEAAEQHRRQEVEELRTVIAQYQPVLMENLLKELLYGVPQSSLPSLWDRMAYLNVPLVAGQFLVAYFEIDDFDTLTRADTFEQRQLFVLRITRRIQECLGNEGSTPLIHLDDAHLAVIFNLAGSDHAALLSKRAYDACARVLVDFLKSDVSLTMALSQTAQGIEEVTVLYQQCLYQMKHKYVLGKGKIILPEDAPAGGNAPDMDFNGVLKEVRFLLNSGTASAIKTYIDGLFRNLPRHADKAHFRNLCFYLMICTQTVLNENHETFQAVTHSEIQIWEKLVGFETIKDATAWIKEIMTTSQQYLAGKSSSRNAQLVERVKKYIESNYVKNVNLEDIAADLFYSANYINRVFKQVTGETVFNYATAYRIEKAKEMLLDPQIKLSSISAALGYSNPAYFSDVFKRATCLTPKEYRERMAK